VWDVATKECRDEITQIDSDSLLLTVEEYLRKHRYSNFYFQILKSSSDDGSMT